MLAIASIGKLKMVIDFPLPVTAPEPRKCGRNLCAATLMAIPGDQQRVISETGCRIWRAPPRLPAGHINFR
jgi:hypothetical protein